MKKTPAKSKISKLYKRFVTLISNNFSNEWTMIFRNPKLPLELSKISKIVGGPGFDRTLV